MFDTMGPSGCGVYFFFASMMICSIVFVFFLLPETKGIPLESMDRLFEVKPVWKANKLILEEERLREEEFRDNADAVGVEMAVAKGKDAHNETV
jgi:hypothetical protein